MARKSGLIVIHSLRQIVQVENNRSRELTGSRMNDVSALESENNDLAILVNGDGCIEAIGPNDEILKQAQDLNVENELDASGKVAIPGLVDGHTHPVWVGNRVHEFALKVGQFNVIAMFFHRLLASSLRF